MTKEEYIYQAILNSWANPHPMDETERLIQYASDEWDLIRKFLKGAIKETREEAILKATELEDAYKKTRDSDSIKFKEESK